LVCDLPKEALPEEPVSEPSRLTELERQLIVEVLTLFDEKGLTREQTLSLPGQLSVLIELVKRRQAQRVSERRLDPFHGRAGFRALFGKTEMAYTNIAQPTQPGAYWFQSETMTREVLVSVHLKDGELIVWWLNQDTPVSNMRGRWRGPIPPTTERGSLPTS
jgi:hypothetical protein